MPLILSPVNEIQTQSDVHVTLRSPCDHGREAWSTACGTRTPVLWFEHKSRWPGAFESTAPFQSAGVSGHPWKKITHYTFWSLKSPLIYHVYPFLSVSLADLAAFHNFISQKYVLTDKNIWICFGGSYAGALSAWFRGKVINDSQSD